jgi:hypothetical protein
MVPPATPHLLDRVRDRTRLKQYTFRIEQAHHDGIKRFIHFHGKRHPPERCASEVEAHPARLDRMSNGSLVADKHQPMSAM